MLMIYNIYLRVCSIGCGGNYTDHYGVFMSPNYPNAYNNNSQCTYTISPSTISSITLIFETFELDRSFEDYISASPRFTTNSSYVYI